MSLDGRTPRALGAAALVLSAVSCGAEDDRPRDAGEPSSRLVDVPSASRSASVEMVEPAVFAYEVWHASLAARDAASACRWQAPELTIELRYDAILQDRAEPGDPCTAFEALLWEDPSFERRIPEISVTQQTKEDALLAVTFASGAEQTVRMVRHRAKWRVFSTSARTGGSESVPGDTRRWLDAWCDLDPTMGREEVVAVMGEPSGEYTVSDGGEPQLWWAQDQYDFRAYLDPAGTDDDVLELVGDYDALSAEDRAVLPCPELRS